MPRKPQTVLRGEVSGWGAAHCTSSSHTKPRSPLSYSHKRPSTSCERPAPPPDTQPLPLKHATTCNKHARTDLEGEGHSYVLRLREVASLLQNIDLFDCLCLHKAFPLGPWAEVVLCLAKSVPHEASLFVSVFLALLSVACFVLYCWILLCIMMRVSASTHSHPPSYLSTSLPIPLR